MGTIFLPHLSFSRSLPLLCLAPARVCVCGRGGFSPTVVRQLKCERDGCQCPPLGVLRHRVSPLLGLSAPAYCDIVALLSQSIVFNRTVARWPNWKGLWPTFHQIHNRVGCRMHRAAEATLESVRFCLPAALLTRLPSSAFFPCCAILVVRFCLEMSLLRPGASFINIYKQFPNQREGERKWKEVWKKTVFLTLQKRVPHRPTWLWKGPI